MMSICRVFSCIVGRRCLLWPIQSLSHLWLFVTPWTRALQASLSFTISQSLCKLMSIESVMPSNHLTLCCSLLLLPSIFPIIGVFSNDSALLVGWPKYWSFSFIISPSNEYSGLISFRIDWFDLLVVHQTLKSLFQKKKKRVFSNTTVVSFQAYNIFKMTYFHNDGQIRGRQGLEVGVGVSCQRVTWGSLGYELFSSLVVLVSRTWQSRIEQKSTKNLRNLNHAGGALLISHSKTSTTVLQNVAMRGIWVRLQEVPLCHSSLFTYWKWMWKLLSRVCVFETPWTKQSMEFSRAEYWSG